MLERATEQHALGLAVRERADQSLLADQPVDQEVLAEELGGVVRECRDDVAVAEVEALLAAGAPNDQGAVAPVVVRPLENVADRERGEASGEFHGRAGMLPALSVRQKDHGGQTPK